MSGKSKVRSRKSKVADQFAAALLANLAGAGSIPFRTTHQTSMDDADDRAHSASEIYDMVDAMLKERAR